jgi:hypothetical protein
MSARFGWIIVAGDLKRQEQELLSDFRPGKTPIRRRKEKASDHIMWKVDDDLELCLGYGKRFTLIQGQFDLGISEPEHIEEMCRKYSKGHMVLWVGVEGTSGTFLFKKFENGALVQSYASREGKDVEKECLGRKPDKDQYGQVGEWELVKEVEKEGISYDAIVGLELEVYNYLQP